MLRPIILPMLFFLVCLSLCRSESGARDLAGIVGMLPPHVEMGADGKPRGGFVEVVKAIGSVYDGGNITISMFPVKRAVDKITKGQADFYIPYIRHPEVPKEVLPFGYASEPVLRASFVLYTRADQPPLPMDRLDRYDIETLRGAAPHFPFRIGEIDSFGQGLQRVVRGRSDGFIVEQEGADAFIRQHRLKNLRRTLYSTLDSCIIVPKEPKGLEVGIILSKALRELKRTGKLQELTEKIHKPYDDWQPYRMAW